MKLFNYLKSVWDKGRYIKFSLLLLLSLGLCVVGIIILVHLINAFLLGVGGFIEANAVVLLPIALGAWWVIDRAMSREQVPAPPLDTDAATLEFLQAPYTFKRILECIFLVSQEVACFLPIENPRTQSSIMAANNFFRKGAFVLYQFQLNKIGDIEEELLKHTLQERIRQKLQAKEFPGFTQDFYLHTSGVAYPMLLVDSVTILAPNIIVNIAIASKNYCSYLESLPRNSKENYGVPNDKHF